MACRQGFTLTHAQAREAGLSGSELRRLIRRGEWAVPRRGVLSPLPAATTEHSGRPHGLHPVVLAAAAALVRRDAVISHECSAMAHGVDVLHIPRLAMLTTCGRRFSGAVGGAVIRAAWLDEDEVVRWYGASLTSCARSVVDIARSGARAGIVAVESALTWGAVTRADLASTIARQHHWDGVITARRIIELAGDGSESPLESLARLFLADRNIPLPDQQQVISTFLGDFRVDGLWADAGVVLEVDGLLKYRLARMPDELDPLTAEKLRQEAIEQAGYRVVRVTWADLHRSPERTEARIRRALGCHAVR